MAPPPPRSQFALLRTRRFVPLLGVQVSAGVADHLFKNAFVVLLIWSAAVAGGEVWATVAAGVFAAPFVLFSALGGQLADRYPREKIVRAAMVGQVGVAILGTLGLALLGAAPAAGLPVCLLALFGLGAASALFAPAKMALLPQYLRPRELVGGNALMSTGLFLSILLGTILAAGLGKVPQGGLVGGLLLLCFALIGYAYARLLPPAPAPAPDMRVEWGPLRATWGLLRILRGVERDVVLAILGVSWFYFAAAVFAAQLPAFTGQTLGAAPGVFAFFMVLFSVGIAVGGLTNHRLLRGRVEATFVPLAALAVAGFTLDLSFARPAPGLEPGAGLAAFLAHPQHWRIALDLCAIAVAGGLFVVPLNAVIQSRAPARSRARVLAASALMNAVFAVAATALSALLLLAGVGIPGLFFALGLAGLAVAVVACALLPAQLVKSLAQALFKALYRVRVEGTEHLATAGPRAVIVANHVSYLDAALLAAFLPGRPVFAINAEVARRWWVAPWGRIVRFFPMEPGNPYALKALIREVEAGAHCVIFPEGRLTETGALMKIYEGPGLVADRADAPIVPVRLQGVQYTPLATRLAGRVPRRWLPRITLTVLPPRPIGIGADLRGRARRAAAGLALYDLMEGMMCATWPRPRPATLWGALIAARALHGAGAPIVQDATRAPVTYGALLRRAVALAGALQGVLPAPEGTRTQDAKPKAPPAVGLLMPTGVAGLVAFFALQALARPAAMLNFSAGPGPALDACRAARASTVLTARAFIERARLAPLVEALEGAGLAVLYLEDIAGRIGPLARLRAALTPARALPGAKAAQPDDVAAILFTSGSEGAPKGVALTHANILANIAQLSCRVDFTPADVVLCALPAFHAFGLTGGVLLPVLSGVRTVLYPSPLHYRIVPEVAYATNATIMFGTDTFLAGYAAKANPYDFYRMRYIFAGAERLRESTRRVYADRFGVRVLEGYGATEAAPVVAVNGPMHNRPGTVGRLLPGIAWRLEPVEGVAAPPGARAGRLLIRGANVMAGYLRAGAPGVLEPPAGGWYDTGDIVAVDAQGYVAITGRAKRFAKVGGEMVSLAAVERLAAAASPGGAHAAVAADDARKGQKVVLVTTDRALKRPALTRAAADAGASALAVPARIVFCEALPLLPTGKVDYAAVAGVAG